jgi:hypothetical protein
MVHARSASCAATITTLLRYLFAVFFISCAPLIGLLPLAAGRRPGRRAAGIHARRTGLRRWRALLPAARGEYRLGQGERTSHESGCSLAAALVAALPASSKPRMQVVGSLFSPPPPSDVTSTGIESRLAPEAPARAVALLCAAGGRELVLSVPRDQGRPLPRVGVAHVHLPPAPLPRGGRVQRSRGRHAGEWGCCRAEEEPPQPPAGRATTASSVRLLPSSRVPPRALPHLDDIPVLKNLNTPLVTLSKS